jgi:ankyrin repeat protein
VEFYLHSLICLYGMVVLLKHRYNFTYCCFCFLQTPLHIAAASTHGVGCLDVLIKMGADINVQSEDGRTPLHMTAIHGRFTRSKTLIDHGKFACNLLLSLYNLFTADNSREHV